MSVSVSPSPFYKPHLDQSRHCEKWEPYLAGTIVLGTELPTLLAVS